MTLEQQENDEEINDDYRPTTNGSDTTASPETNPENEDSVSSNGTIAGPSGINGTAPAAPITPNWNQSK